MPIADPQPYRSFPSSRRRPQASSGSVAATVRIDERRRRQQHFRGRRRDLLQDVAIGILLTTIVLTYAAGLGVVALLEVLVAGTMIGSALARRVRRTRLRTPVRTARPPIPPARARPRG
ncbi:MAG: hypothetical protein ACR2OB_04265 [Solirubrobacteraceae bacterium]